MHVMSDDPCGIVCVGGGNGYLNRTPAVGIDVTQLICHLDENHWFHLRLIVEHFVVQRVGKTDFG